MIEGILFQQRGKARKTGNWRKWRSAGSRTAMEAEFDLLIPGELLSFLKVSVSLVEHPDLPGRTFLLWEHEVKTHRIAASRTEGHLYELSDDGWLRPAGFIKDQEKLRPWVSPKKEKK